MISKVPKQMALLIAANAVANELDRANWQREYRVNAQIVKAVEGEIRTIERELWRRLETAERTK